MNDWVGDFLCSYATQGWSPGNESACLASVWFSPLQPYQYNSSIIFRRIPDPVNLTTLDSTPSPASLPLSPGRQDSSPLWACEGYLGGGLFAYSEWGILWLSLSSNTASIWILQMPHMQCKGHLSDLKIFMLESVSWCKIFYLWHQKVSHLGWLWIPES